VDVVSLVTGDISTVFTLYMGRNTVIDVSMSYDSGLVVINYYNSSGSYIIFLEAGKRSNI